MARGVKIDKVLPVEAFAGWLRKGFTFDEVATHYGYNVETVRDYGRRVLPDDLKPQGRKKRASVTPDVRVELPPFLHNRLTEQPKRAVERVEAKVDRRRLRRVEGKDPLDEAAREAYRDGKQEGRDAVLEELREQTALADGGNAELIVGMRQHIVLGGLLHDLDYWETALRRALAQVEEVRRVLDGTP